MDQMVASKREFILNQPEDLPAPQVVEVAKEAGIEFNTAYVHSVRSQRRTAKKSSKKSKSAPGAKRKAAVADQIAAEQKRVDKQNKKRTKLAKRAPIPALAARVARAQSPITTEHAQKRADEEAVFRRLTINIGLTRAHELVREVSDLSNAQ